MRQAAYDAHAKGENVFSAGASGYWTRIYNENKDRIHNLPTPKSLYTRWLRTYENDEDATKRIEMNKKNGKAHVDFAYNAQKGDSMIYSNHSSFHQLHEIQHALLFSLNRSILLDERRRIRASHYVPRVRWQQLSNGCG